jgi:biopolymer transport protein ExbB
MVFRPLLAQLADSPLSAEVDWAAEVLNGGMTSVALGALLLMAVALIVERAVHLRLPRFLPAPVLVALADAEKNGQWELASRACASHPSLLSRVFNHIETHRGASPGLVVDGALEMVDRRMRMESQANSLLAVAAALAPLLGLLGTMIGMIEAFKLVEVYGDEGGASMLAGSISKALITTALGLIIAIGVLVFHHWNRHRISKIANKVEEEVEKIVAARFLRG